jgi:hypothetical protein
MLHIKNYNKTIIIDNDIEEIIIDELKHPLDNIPPMVNKITVKKVLIFIKDKIGFHMGVNLLYYCDICDFVFFSQLYKDKHINGKRHAIYVRAVELQKKN